MSVNPLSNLGRGSLGVFSVFWSIVVLFSNGLRIVINRTAIVNEEKLGVALKK